MANIGIPLPVTIGQKTQAELIQRVRQLVGRTGNVNTTLDFDGMIRDALNEAQFYIVRKHPQILELQVKDVTSLVAVENQYAYDLAEIDPPIAHLSDVWILDGTGSTRLRRKHKEDFDAKYPDVASIASGLPKYYTRRGSVIEFNCPASAAVAGKVIRLDYCRWPIPFTSETSNMTGSLHHADEGLILYAWAQVLRIIARGDTALLTTSSEKLAQFAEWLETFTEYHDMQTEELTYGT